MLLSREHSFFTSQCCASCFNPSIRCLPHPIHKCSRIRLGTVAPDPVLNSSGQVSRASTCSSCEVHRFFAGCVLSRFCFSNSLRRRSAAWRFLSTASRRSIRFCISPVWLLSFVGLGAVERVCSSSERITCIIAINFAGSVMVSCSPSWLFLVCGVSAIP